MALEPGVRVGAAAVATGGIAAAAGVGWAVPLHWRILVTGGVFVAGLLLCPVKRTTTPVVEPAFVDDIRLWVDGPRLRFDGAMRSDRDEQHLRRAAEAGEVAAMTDLGILAQESGRAAEAADWFRRAAERGHLAATVNIGVVCHDAGQVDEARRWWRQAATRGNTAAMGNLGVSHWSLAGFDDAERWWRRAARAGDIDAMFHLGCLSDAEWWWPRAARRGSVEAAAALGALLALTGRTRGALRWFRLAARQSGDLWSVFNVCWALDQLGRHREARQWYVRAAEIADQAAMAQLHEALTAVGRADEAAEWSRRVAAAGGTAA